MPLEANPFSPGPGARSPAPKGSPALPAVGREHENQLVAAMAAHIGGDDLPDFSQRLGSTNAPDARALQQAAKRARAKESALHAMAAGNRRTLGVSATEYASTVGASEPDAYLAPAGRALTRRNSKSASELLGRPRPGKAASAAALQGRGASRRDLLPAKAASHLSGLPAHGRRSGAAAPAHVNALAAMLGRARRENGRRPLTPEGSHYVSAQSGASSARPTPEPQPFPPAAGPAGLGAPAGPRAGTALTSSLLHGWGADGLPPAAARQRAAGPSGRPSGPALGVLGQRSRGHISGQRAGEHGASMARQDWWIDTVAGEVLGDGPAPAGGAGLCDVKGLGPGDALSRRSPSQKETQGSRGLAGPGRALPPLELTDRVQRVHDRGLGSLGAAGGVSEGVRLGAGLVGRTFRERRADAAGFEY